MTEPRRSQSAPRLWSVRTHRGSSRLTPHGVQKLTASVRRAVTETPDFQSPSVIRAATHNSTLPLPFLARTISLCRVELRHLRYFVAVAEELNFTRAAARLHTSQPSLSQQIRQLESAVGVMLLDRSRHHVALTNAGRIFLRETKDILGRIEHAGRLAKRAADGRAGDLSVGTFPAADVRILPGLRPLMAARLPHLQLILHSKYAVEPVAGLLAGTLDLAFVRGPIESDELQSRELLREEIVMMLPAHHPLARRKRVPVELLN